ncbi:hypothetical protein ACEWY4_012707 [Coilia grayii]|uniref:ZMYM2-like/QRICH1 C-terminal domain-containing protein n=1 Tax=Coilia grayii TaxID=363190 RepID=A0ABD1K1A9_9TELE
MDDFDVNFNIFGDKTPEQWWEENFPDGEKDNDEPKPKRHKTLTKEEVDKIEEEKSFVVRVDENGNEFLSFSFNPDSKNHKDPCNSKKEQLCGFIYAAPGDPLCAVQSFKKYVSKCPKDASAFYLHPRRASQALLNTCDVWYTREPMGVNTLREMLKNICKEVG